MEKKKKLQKCPYCKGSGKIPVIIHTRRWCDECGDKGHGCFGSGIKKKGRELGHSYCYSTEYVYEIKPEFY